MVLDAVPSPHSQRNYARALDDLFQFCASRPLSRFLLMEWRAGMESLSPSTINVRLSAVRKLVSEARKNGMLGAEEAATRNEVEGGRRPVCTSAARKIGVLLARARDGVPQEGLVTLLCAERRKMLRLLFLGWALRAGTGCR